MSNFPIEALKRYVVLASIYSNSRFSMEKIDVNKNVLEAAKTIKEIDMLFGRNQPQQPQQPQYQQPQYQQPQYQTQQVPQYQPPPQNQVPQYQPPPPAQVDPVYDHINNLQQQITQLRSDLSDGLNELESIMKKIGESVIQRDKKKGS